MDARTPVTHIPGYSRARLKRMIALGNDAAFALGLWTILFRRLYTVGLSLCVLLPLWALALEMRTRGALGFESRRWPPLSTLAGYGPPGTCDCARHARGDRSQF